MCGISGQKERKFQLRISQTSETDRATSNDVIFASISADYATTASCPKGRLTYNYINNSIFLSNKHETCKTFHHSDAIN